MVLVHLESPKGVVDQADVVGSTSQLIKAAKDASCDQFIVATDQGIFYKMRQAHQGRLLWLRQRRGMARSVKAVLIVPGWR